MNQSLSTQTNLFQAVQPAFNYTTPTQAEFNSPTNEAEILDFIRRHGVKLHDDPAHRWLQVPAYMVEALGIAASIGQWSYKDDINAYLDSELDIDTFLDAIDLTSGSLRSKFIDYCQTIQYNHPSNIRNKERFIYNTSI